VFAKEAFFLEVVMFEAIWEIIKLIGEQVNNQINANQALGAYLRNHINRNEKLGKDWIGEDNEFLLDMQQAYVPALLKSDAGEFTHISSALAKHDRLVIVGDAGAGKSTLGRFLTLIMAKAISNRRAFNHLSSEHFGIAAIFPFQIELKKCNDGKSIEEMLLDVDIESNRMSKMFANGNNLFLFDGLDEIAGGHQGRVLDEIVELTHKWRFSSDQKKRNYFIVTTRPATYDHRMLAGANYTQYFLSGLTLEQQDLLVKRYYKLWPESKRNTTMGRDKQASELMKQLKENEALARLSPNPFLLAQMARLHYTGRFLPSQRHELYHVCLTELVTRREGRIKPQKREVNRRLDLLGELALEMHQHKQALEIQDVESVLSTAIQKREFNGDVYKLLDQMEDEWGVLIKDGAYYSFLNFSLQEYLAAWICVRYPDE